MMNFRFFNEEWNEDTKPPSDDDWGDELEDGIHDFIAKKKKPTHIEDEYEEYGN